MVLPLFKCPLGTCAKVYAGYSHIGKHIQDHVDAGELPEQPKSKRGGLVYENYKVPTAPSAGPLQDGAQERNTAQLPVPDKAQRDWADAGFKAAAAQFTQRVQPSEAAVNTAFDPAATAKHLLAAHIHDLPQDAALKQRVLRVYHEHLDFAQEPAVTTFDILEHPGSAVADVMQALREAGDRFSHGGAVLVKAGSSNFNTQRKLGQFLQHGGQIRAWPGDQELGEGGLWRSQEEKEASATVHDMAVWGHAVEDAVCKLASRWGLIFCADSHLHLFCFMSALLRCLPSSLSTLYEPDLDIMTNKEHTSLLRGREATLLNTDGAKLPVVGWLDVDENSLFVDINSPHDASLSNSQAASAWSLSDDATGPLLREMFAPGSTSEPVRVAVGVQIATIILSQAYTYTPAHIEDLLLGAVNMLLDGAWKVWFIVPPACADKFKAVMLRKHGPGAIARILAKQLRPDLTAAEMREVGVRLLFQPPGYMVVSSPGEVFHWTLSLGYSVAEAANCFIQLPGEPSLAETVQHWEQHVEEARRDWQAANPEEAGAIEEAWDNRMANSAQVKTFMGM